LACLALTGQSKADEYLGKIKKVEKDNVTLSVGDKETKEVEIKLHAGTRVLNIRGDQVKNKQLKEKILEEGSIVIITTERYDNKLAKTIQPLGG
jgi:copper chaperone CopZ